MELDERKQQLIELVVNNHMKNSEPVGSNFLVEAGDLDVSGATVRNEMQELEDEGFISQPHTSAGRVPTEEGYRYYVNNLMETKELEQQRQQLQKIFEENDGEREKLKQTAKKAAEDVSAAVIIAFDQDNVYYTGLSKLFSQPEFQDYDYTLHMSQIFDHCEEQIATIERILKGNLDVLIGSNNPLGGNCSVVASRLGERTIFMVLGPIRMDYPEAVSFNKCLLDLTK